MIQHLTTNDKKLCHLETGHNDMMRIVLRIVMRMMAVRMVMLANKNNLVIVDLPR